MSQESAKVFIVTGLLFLIGFLFILYIALNKGKGIGSSKIKGLWVKFATYFLIVNGFLLMTFAGKPYFYIMLFPIIAFGLHEFFELLRKKEIAAFRNAGILAGCGIFLVAVIYGQPLFYLTSLVVFIAVLISPVLKNEVELSIERVSSTMLSVFYAGIMPTYLVFIFNLKSGINLVAFFFLILTMNDGFSELFGRLFGNRGIWNRISPNKTLSGSLGGFVSSLAGAIVFRFLLPDKPILEVLAIGAIVAVCGQLGDLVASVFKRDASVKDFSNILPYHGGILDRFDSLIFAAPVLYYVSYYILA